MAECEKQSKPSLYNKILDLFFMLFIIGVYITSILGGLFVNFVTFVMVYDSTIYQYDLFNRLLTLVFVIVTMIIDICGGITIGQYFDNRDKIEQDRLRYIKYKESLKNNGESHD